MGGGLMQLVAYGAQDVFLTGKPEISFFKVVYRRHTNFAMESIQQTLNGTTKFGNRLTSTVSRNGDLITNMWLEVDVPLPDGSSKSTTNEYVNSLGHALIEYVELEIGGQRIDKHYGEYLEILSELTMPEEKRRAFNIMIGRREHYDIECNRIDDATTATAGDVALTSTKLYIPLQFFFCRNPGLALPLIALQYHEVKINLKLRDAALLLNRSGRTISNDPTVKLYVDYVYLDTTERRRFAQMQHEYLIEQLQHTGPMKASDTTQRLNFNHPVKELIWVFRRDKAEVVNFNVAGEGLYPVTSALDSSTTTEIVDISEDSALDLDNFSKMKLQLNGHDRFSERDAPYFKFVQPYQHHTRVPLKQPIYCYSFALNPEAHQPSGTCNFSRLDNVSMKFTHVESTASHKLGSSDELLVYAINYNVLRIVSGMGGLSYSN